MSNDFDLSGTWRVKDNRRVENLHGHWIAETGGKTHSQLIFAAPELLLALQMMLSKAHKQNWNDKYPEEVEAAQAAIDKALGQ
ncbi:hypothetical protein [Pantoea stewartii]|uniref:hypothetical protein n=1 Tax=Pantoea stewartii TaxID=66269 RepID=UPI0025A1F328|nr:hypothetical protein [Pantoea stewartii]